MFNLNVTFKYVCCFIILLLHLQTVPTHYLPIWEDLDSRPIPEWYDSAKFGIMVHWGLYSVPGFGNEWFWKNWVNKKKPYVSYMKNRFPKNFTYKDFDSYFTAKYYSPKLWASIFKYSGARYVVLTSKHHDGFTLWPSFYSKEWNARYTGAAADLVKELAKAISSKQNMKFGVYYSLYEWFHPLYLFDAKSSFKNNTYVTNKMIPELHELVESYKPSIIWAGGDFTATDDYWQSREFLSWLYNKSPVREEVVVNDRWGKNCRGKHGGFFSFTRKRNYVYREQHKWERAMSIDKKSWGFRRAAKFSDIRSTYKILLELVQAVSGGGNFILNIGPTRDGLIPPIIRQRLLNIGSWFRNNGESIYDTVPWKTDHDCITPGVWYTTKHINHRHPIVYVFARDWPQNNVLRLGAPKLENDSKVIMLNTKIELTWRNKAPGIEVQFPQSIYSEEKTIWTLKMIPVIDNLCDLKYQSV